MFVVLPESAPSVRPLRWLLRFAGAEGEKEPAPPAEDRTDPYAQRDEPDRGARSVCRDHDAERDRRDAVDKPAHPGREPLPHAADDSRRAAGDEECGEDERVGSAARRRVSERDEASERVDGG